MEETWFNTIDKHKFEVVSADYRLSGKSLAARPRPRHSVYADVAAARPPAPYGLRPPAARRPAIRQLADVGCVSPECKRSRGSRLRQTGLEEERSPSFSRWPARPTACRPIAIMNIYLSIYLYIYIYIERERDVHIYIYIYIHMYVCIS